MTTPRQTETAIDTTNGLNCYHCGEAVPANSHFFVTIGDTERAMCCPGCSAVAQLIAGNGLDSFYLQRTAFNERPAEEKASKEAQYALYNDPAVYEQFSDSSADGLLHSRLLLGGISCAACTWLIEQSLRQLPGVEKANVNYSQSRLEVSFNPTSLPPGDIFALVDALGYQARPYRASARKQLLAEEYRTDLRRLAVAGIGMMQVGMFAIALHAGDIQGIEWEYQSLLRWVSLLVASFVIAYSARPFFITAWRHLKARSLVMDLPVSLAIGLAWLASVWATFSGTGQVYFDSAVMFTFFLLLGRFLERRARQKYELAWFDAESSLPTLVKVRRGKQWVDITRQALPAGATMLIARGETVAADAIICKGHSAMNEATFNGEHRPRTVTSGDAVYAGTVNLEEAIEVIVEGTFVDTRLAALQRSVEQGRRSKPGLERLADRIAGVFVGFILVLTGLTLCAWLWLDPDRALWVTLSVLVVSCPCALALATPAALTGATNGLRRAGIAVQGESALESLAKCTHLIFDKTGTLTRGQLTLSKVLPLNECSETDLLDLAASLQAYSKHPLAAAFSHIPGNRQFDHVEYRVGEGLQAHSGDRQYRIGSQVFCQQLAPQLPPPPDAARYWIALCQTDQPLAWIALEDEVRPEAAITIAQAQQLGLEIELLSGDASALGPEIAQQLGINTVHSGASPQQKMQYVQGLQSAGAIVAMVGDGLNDAPVLSVANASIAVAGATGLARTQADLILLDQDLSGVIRAITQSRRATRIIHQNLGWALAYNLSAIPLAASGFIPPWLAAIGMSASSLLVVLNSLRLNTLKPIKGS